MFGDDLELGTGTGTETKLTGPKNGKFKVPPEFKIPGLWSSSVTSGYCCIYRVPDRLRKVNPEAYTPQMLLIGPLHHSKKDEAFELYKTDLR